MSAATFAGDPDRCYLTDGRRHARRYWEHLRGEDGTLAATFPGLPQEGACPFAYDAQQTMRNHAFARGLVRDGHADFSGHGLVHHDGNTDVRGYFERYRAMSADPHLFRIPASEVVRAISALPGRVGHARWLGERYVL